MDTESQNPFESPSAVDPRMQQPQAWNPERRVTSWGGWVVWVVGLTFLISGLVWLAG